ncbi:hypothetical protein F5878DRAFT_697457 [Lentinula raphanica]|uniref:Uncharacterized protein n=1 Tax=Lentinula raphanica TaxID=153919 RepID=A0AA38U8D8_9AGAR|nr:hypothetical protein F5878DRAFT_697457 [Lentinula raphanica]
MSNPLAIQNLLNPIPSASRNPHSPSIPIISLLNPAPSSALRLVQPELDQESQEVNISIPRTLCHENYRLSRQTVLSKVYQYDPSTPLEYPDTGAATDVIVGHLFEMSLDMWVSPARDFAYSRGEPRGRSKGQVFCSLLVDSRTGDMVPCTVNHSTCQGVKVCPFHKLDEEEKFHSSATRNQLQVRMRHSMGQQDEDTSPRRDIFQRTSAYITALMRIGCVFKAPQLASHLASGPTSGSTSQGRHEIRRGYPEAADRCTGRLLFQTSFAGTPYIKCEHYSHLNHDHFLDNTIGDGRFDLEYLEAVLLDDDEEAARIESEAQIQGYGPRVGCQTVVNNTAQRPVCPWNHRDDSDGVLKQPKLISLECRCTFREYAPLEEYRIYCPYILITSKGPHSHPIPLPEKTPRVVKTELDSLFKQLEVDLADLTPRRFLRHPILQSFLSTRYPMLRNPMLSDLHISLSNRSHLKVYIEHAKNTHFPEGTGWKGLLHFKQQQDTLLKPEEHYLRVAFEIPSDKLTEDDYDSNVECATNLRSPLRIAICMTSLASQRFIKASYLQSDIAFKRIVGFYEFEIAALDRNSNTNFTFCRVYLTRQTAEAHRLVLNKINEVLVNDTGRGLQFRHIHGHDSQDYSSGLILNWVVDQHRGQAKGIGLFVQDLAKELPPSFDFHETQRIIQTLSPYDHLRRFLTLCTTHLYRNIRERSVSENVWNAMRSWICITHDDWDGRAIVREPTFSAPSWLTLIRSPTDWVDDKESCKFAFPAMCWSKSFIPLDIWRARDRESNIVEVAHADVNLEGTKCTLLGGLYKGRHFDLMKQRFLQNREDFGVRESYASKHRYENAVKNTKRKAHSRTRNLMQEDSRIQAHNTKIINLLEKWKHAHAQVTHCAQSLNPLASSSNFTPRLEDIAAYEKAMKKSDQAQKAFEAQRRVGQSLGGTGSGRIWLVLPAGLVG